MTYFLKKKKWMAWVVLLTFLFTSFMPSNILAGNSVAEAAISGSDTVEVGETITLTGTSTGSANQQHQENWSSSNSAVATVSYTANQQNGYKASTATVTGVSEGQVTITHTYYTQSKGQWKSNTEQYTVEVTAAGPKTVTFDVNGGSGTVPDQSGEIGTTITLPSGDSLSRSGYTFMGWGKTTSSGGAAATDKTIYPAGYEWTIEGNQTLYAVWGTSKDAYYFVRLDGQIPTEPGSYAASAYTDDADAMHGTVKYNTFYADSVNGVDSHLGTVPSTTAIRNACNAKVGSIKFGDGSDYTFCDSDTDFNNKYYVLWYVVKQDPIHVDGVLLKRDLYNVKYAPNALSGEYTGNVPMGGQ